MLKVHIKRFSYGKKEIFCQIHLDLPSSQIIGLVAPNGTGKSTLMQIISGQLQNNDIVISCHGKTYEKDTLYMRKHIVKMPDQDDLYNELSGLEHLNFYASMWEVDLNYVQKVVQHLHMESYIGDKVSSYSLGMRQRLCFALVMVTQADYMLLDEVMNGLDPDNVQLLSNVLYQLKTEGKTILIASHLLNNLDEIADTVYFIKNKQVALSYSPHSSLEFLQLRFISSQSLERFIYAFPMVNADISKDKLSWEFSLSQNPQSIRDIWNWIIHNMNDLAAMKLGNKGSYELYKELYRGDSTC